LDGREELASGEGLEGAETGVHLGGGEAAVAEEPAEKIRGRTFAFQGIAFEAAGNEIAVRIASTLGAGNDVIEDLGARVVAESDRRVDGAGGGREAVRGDCAGTSGAYFVGEAHLENVAGLAAVDEAERAQGGQAADGFADGAGAQADSASEPGHGAVELELAFEAGVAEKMRIDSAVGDGEAEPRIENVLELLPEKRGIQFLGFHVRS